MLVLRCMIAIAVGTGVCQAYRKYPRLEDLETTFSHFRDQIPNFPKESDVYRSFPDFITSRQASPPAAPPTSDCTAHLTDILSSSYQIGDLSFAVATSTGAGVLERHVLVNCGDLRGLDDFERVRPSFIDDRRDGLGDKCLFSWSRLRATCAVTTVLDGLRDYLGETEVRFNSLFVEVEQKESGPRVNVVPVGMKLFNWLEEENMRNLSQEEKEDIKRELSTRIQGDVNSQVADLLKDLVKEGLGNREGMCQCASE